MPIAASRYAQKDFAYLERCVHDRTVPSVDSATLVYDAFVTNFMAPNRPALIRGAASSWPASDLVDIPSETPGGRIGIGRLAARCGDATVRVSSCSGPRGTQSMGVEERKLSDFADWWTKRGPDASPILYLKVMLQSDAPTRMHRHLPCLLDFTDPYGVTHCTLLPDNSLRVRFCRTGTMLPSSQSLPFTRSHHTSAKIGSTISF